MRKEDMACSQIGLKLVLVLVRRNAVPTQLMLFDDLKSGAISIQNASIEKGGTRIWRY